MADKKVVIYATPTCPNCKWTKEYLTEKGVQYTDLNVAGSKELIKEMIDKSGQMSVPVIVIDNQVVVGFNQGKIDKLLSRLRL
jgi:glutaredoxin 3